jgi:ERCC4-type nuclease
MTFSLFVDPGELKSSSKFKRCKGIRNFKPIPLPGLEEITGADIIISPANLPKPINRHLLKIHLNEGALLVQLKFGFDLIASIVDNRLKSSQAKMLATGASQSQIILLFIGLVFEPEKESSELMINSKYVRNIVPAAKNLRYKHYLEQRLKWSLRGGIFEQITLNDSLATWIESAAKVAFNEPVSKQVWEPQQKLYLVDDWRNVMVNLPGIGEQKAQDIYDWLVDKSFYEFLDALEDETLTNVPGIGPGIIRKIKSYLKGE